MAKKKKINHKHIAQVRKNYSKREKKRFDPDIALESGFLDLVSHELRTPLAIMKEGVTLVANGDLGSVTKEQHRALQLSLKSIDRLIRLVNELLDVSQLEKGKVRLNKKIFDLAILCQEVYRGFEKLADKENRNIIFEETTDCDQLKTYADPDKITQVLVNLAHNALKFTKPGGLIKISLTNKKDIIFVSILDQGPGIPKTELPLIFKKFHQIKQHRQGGLGLGLSIVKQLIELHGGQLLVKSQEGQGTEFVIKFPLVIPFLAQVIKIIRKEGLSQEEIKRMRSYGLMKLLIETMEYSGLDIDEREELLKALQEMKLHKGNLPSIWDHIDDFKRLDIKDEAGNPLKAENYKEAFLMAYIEKNMGEFRFNGKPIYDYGDTEQKRKALMQLVKSFSKEQIENKLSGLEK